MTDTALPLVPSPPAPTAPVPPPPATAAGTTAPTLLPVQEASAKLEKAYLALIDPIGDLFGVAKALYAGISSGSVAAGEQSLHNYLSDHGDVVNLRFNPNSYTVTAQNQIASFPSPMGGSAAARQYMGASGKSLSIEVLLDDSESTSGSVVADCDLLMSACSPGALDSLVAQATGIMLPKLVIFGWGWTVQFLAIMQSVSVTYERFRPNGIPYRAKAQLQMLELPLPIPGQNPTSGTRDVKRGHQLQDGATLAHVAQAEYRKPTMWRVIAEANGIDDPLRVAAGTRLLVPPPQQALAQEGSAPRRHVARTAATLERHGRTS